MNSCKLCQFKDQFKAKENPLVENWICKHPAHKDEDGGMVMSKDNMMITIPSTVKLIENKNEIPKFCPLRISNDNLRSDMPPYNIEIL